MINLKVFEDSNLFFEDTYEGAQDILVGRGSTCDIVLNGNPGVSREHFVIKINDELSLDINVISASGKLIHLGTNIKKIEITSGTTTVSLPPYDFTFEIPEKEEEKKQEEEIQTLESPDDNNKKDIINKENNFEENEKNRLLSSKSQNNTALPEFDHDEKTKVAISAPLEYSMKIFKEERMLQELSLKGSSWDFGRDKKCHYTIKSKKTSRKHFTIINNNSKFFVKDLGSSNGTFLNKQQLPVNQEIELKSGDFIEVSNFRFIFEIKDNSFDRRVRDVELITTFDSNDDIQSLRESALAVSDEFMKLPPSQRPSALAKKSKKTNYLRPALLIFIIGIAAFYFMQEDPNKLNSAELASIAQQKRLAQEEINTAVDKFNLALRFYNESQFERCTFEIDEFFKYDIQTEETAGAIELKNQCDIEKERQQRQKDLEIQKEKQLAIEKRISEIILECTPKAIEGVAVLKPCIEEVYSLDPANSKVQNLLDLAESRDIEREQELENKKIYQKNVNLGKSLYTKAHNYDKYGDWKRAIKAYNKHLRSKHPDPKNLKKKSTRNIASINSRINRVLSESIDKAKNFAADNKYKETILSANEGLEVNRDHKKLLKIKSTAEQHLNMILRRYYQESIIQEDYSEVAEAQMLWKKILKEGVPGSNYHQKAKVKLKYYEGRLSNGN